MRRGPIFVIALAALALVVPAQADIAVRFVGDLVAGNLSPETEAEVLEFFDEEDLADLSFACYEGDLEDLETGRVVGIGVDCLRPEVLGDTTSGATTPVFPPALLSPVANTIDASAAITAVTFFFFPGGHIVSEGRTSVRPFFEGVGDGDGATVATTVTHLTGSFPGTASTVTDASGRFSKLVGRARVRLSGAVDLSQFDPLGSGNTRVFFNCLFVIKHGKGKGQGGPANN